MKTIIVGLSILLTWTSISYANDWNNIPVYPQAQDVRKFELFDGAAYEVFFTVSAPYPFRGVIEHYDKSIKGTWIPCTLQPEGWQGFGDVSRETPRYIHQYLKYWANFDKKRLLHLAIRYYSAGAEYRKEPDNTTQNVFFVEYKEKDLSKALSRLSLKCKMNDS